jgi:hypothetical protein
MQYCAADDQQFSDANVHRYFFTCVSRLFQQLANTDTKETLTARILRPVPRIPTGSLSNYLIFRSAVHARSPAAVDGLMQK